MLDTMVQKQMLNLSLYQEMRKQLPLSGLFSGRHLPRLLYLSLSFCKLESLDLLYTGTIHEFICGNLRLLNVSNNNLTALPYRLPVPELIVSYNQIESAGTINCLLIDISFNKIKAVEQLPEAEMLCIEGNPVEVRARRFISQVKLIKSN